MIEPRAYQLEALEAVGKSRLNGVTRQLISLPTGTGKTVIFALLAKSINMRTLIIAHTEELIKQAKEKLEIVWPEADVGIVKAGFDEVSAHVVIASIQTISRSNRLQKLKEQEFDLLIIDEAHHAAASSYEKVVKELGFLNSDPSKLLVGVTATPKRGDGVGLGTIFQEIVFERSISTMIRGGYLSPLVGKQVFTKIELGGVGVRHGDFITSQLARAVNTSDRNQLILENYRVYASDRRKAIAFCVDVQHAKDLADAFNEAGISAQAVYGDMSSDDRVSVLMGFRDGKYRILTNCNLLTEGFDQADVDCVIMGRPTKSPALFTQMIGRGTRTFPQKKDCLVLDFCDNASRNNLCSYKNTLDGAVAALFDPGRDEEVGGCVDMSDDELGDSRASEGLEVCLEGIEDIEFFDSAQFAWVSVGDSWHLNLGLNRDVWVRQVNGGFLVVAQSDGDIAHLSSRHLPLDYALGVAEDWSRRQTTKSAWARKDAAWRTLPPTDKQMGTLLKLGIPLDRPISRGEASQILDSKFNEPATGKQRYWLRSHGFSFDQGITKLQATKMIGAAKGG